MSYSFHTMDSGDEFQSLSSSNVSDNLGHTIRVLWPYIKSRVILHHVIAEMPCMSQASSEVYCCREDKEKVSEVFFQHLQAIDDPGKYQQFLAALNDNYPLIVSVIKGDGNSVDEENERLIQLFLKRLADAISPAEMSQELQQRDIISADEGIKIRSIASKDGPLDAALYLLTRIHCHKESWYTEFLEVLWVMDLKDLVRDIDDKFHAKKTPATDEDMNHSSLSPTSNESTEPHFERQEPRTEERFPLASGSSEQGDVTVPNVPQESFVEKAPGDNSLMKAILDQMKELTTHQGACVEALAQVSNRLEVLEGKVDLILESL